MQDVVVFLGLLAVMLVIAVLASRWRRPSSLNSLDEWGVGGRAFGYWVTWFLLGGSSFTAYTLVGVPAYVWGVGAVGFYAVPFALITVPLTYIVSTRGWSIAHVHGFVTSAEFVRVRFGSRALSLVIAIVGILATLPYIGVQLLALQAVFKVVGVQGEWPLLASLAVVSISTFRSGLRAPALLSIAKDVLLVWLVLSSLLVVAMSGGWGGVFSGAQQRFEAYPAPGTGLILSPSGQWTYLSLVVGSALSVFAYPHALTVILAAKDRNTIRRNAAALPVYCIVLGLFGLLGLFAVAKGIVPLGSNLAAGVVGDTNTIMPLVFHNLFPAWCAGLAYATLTVAALIPAAIMSISAANLFTRSVYVEYFRPRASPVEEARVSRWTSLVMKFGAAAVILAFDSTFSANLQLIGSIVVLQLVPAVFLGVMTGWFHRWALMMGILVGLGTSAVLLYDTPLYSATGAIVKPHFGGSVWPLANWGIHTTIGLYIGLITLVVNLVVVVTVTLLLKVLRASPNRDLTRPEEYLADADEEGFDRLDFLLDGARHETGAHSLR